MVFAVLCKNVNMRDYEKIHRDYQVSGLSLRQFCKQNEYSYGSIFNRFKERGLKVNKRYPRKSQLSSADVLKIKELLTIQRLRIDEAALLFKTTPQKIYRSFKRCGIDYKFHKNTCRLKYNHRFFENIDSEEKAYLLGWLFSDGNINKNQIHVTIQNEDGKIIQLFKHFIGGNIKSYRRRESHHKDQLRWYANSKYLADDLRRLGLQEDKSHKEMSIPKMRDDLYRHFIRGFFDGDGSIYKTNRNINIKFICTSLNFLHQIEEQIGGKSARYGFCKTNDVKCLIFGTKEDRNLISKLFYDSCKYFLDRKLDKFAMYVNTELSNKNKNLLPV